MKEMIIAILQMIITTEEVGTATLPMITNRITVAKIDTLPMTNLTDMATNNQLLVQFA